MYLRVQRHPHVNKDILNLQITIRSVHHFHVKLRQSLSFSLSIPLCSLNFSLLSQFLCTPSFFLSLSLSHSSLYFSLSCIHGKWGRWILISIRSRKFRPLLNFTNWRVCKYARFIALKIITIAINLRTRAQEISFENWWMDDERV